MKDMTAGMLWSVQRLVRRWAVWYSNSGSGKTFSILQSRSDMLWDPQNPVFNDSAQGQSGRCVKLTLTSIFCRGCMISDLRRGVDKNCALLDY